jgi:predicted transcriptional regulator
MRFFIMDRIIQSGAPVNINSLKQSEELKHLNIETIINNLTTKKAIVQDSEGNINFVYPVSALPTNHHVVLEDGRALYAMCAVDALGVALTFKQDTKISAKCSHCGETVTVEVQEEKIVKLHPPTTHVLHVDLKNNDNWAGSC